MKGDKHQKSSAAAYVGSFLTLHNNVVFLLDNKTKIIGLLLNIVHCQASKNIILCVTNESERLHHYSTLFTVLILSTST